VSDQDVVPIDHVERSVGRELEVYRAEVGISAYQQILSVVALIAGAIIFQCVFFGTQESYGIIDKEVACTSSGK